MRGCTTFGAGSQAVSRSRRSVVAVSGRSQPAELLDALSIDASDCDVIFVESVARGYSRIKQLRPDLVLVFLEIDDVAACQLLSMLKIDGDTSRIPVVTLPTRREKSEFEDIIAWMNEDSSCPLFAIGMN